MPKITKSVLTKTESGDKAFYRMEEVTKTLPNEITLIYSNYKKGYCFGDIFVPLEAVAKEFEAKEEGITRD